MKAQEIFFGTDEKLRSGWRFLVFAFAYIITGAILSALAAPIFISLEQNALSIFVIGSLVGLIPALVIGWLCGKYLERLPFRALGAWFTGGWFLHLVAGLVIGSVTLCIAIAIASIFGNLDFSLNTADSSAITQTLLTSLLIFGVAAAFEEALFRGYILQTFMRSGHVWFGILFTSIIFASVHNANPNASVFSWTNTFIAGVWFGVAYSKTRDLWFVWGLHWIWNWMQGAIFGVEVSGLTEIVHSPLLKETDGGPVWLTGGNYGIEASIACTIALVVSTVAIHFVPFLKADEEMLALTSEPPVVADERATASGS